MRKLTLLVSFLVCVSVANAQFKINDKSVGAAVKAGKALTVSDAEILAYTKEYIDWMDEHNPVCVDDEYATRLANLTAGLENHDGLNLNIKAYRVVDVNAFACADGSIRVFAGLMDVMTDEEILGIIGHEIGHVKNSDIKNAFKTALLTSALKDGIASQGGTAATLTESQFGDLAEALTNATYSQKQENAADDYGYKFLKECGKNPWAMALSFEKLNEMFQSNAGTMDRLLSTHPDTEKRAKRMAEKATKDGFERPANN
ncbi:MAG: M48 family metallopeptidase [Candidatus Azobacteroides sp.]|nr:M48 family metallopeptidase [Candidatus Azobacteroides sp.]